ncbi:MAG: hypothetical protein K6V97_09060 [Actinomycetia bacterium]|nr:hypothetical protein [Actinomycetes bacterium]
MNERQRWSRRLAALLVPGALAVLAAAAQARTALATGQPVSLTASLPEARTGEPVDLTAVTAAPLAPGQTLAIVNVTTAQIVASGSQSPLVARVVTNDPGTERFLAELTTYSTPVEVDWAAHPNGTTTGYQNAAGQTVSLLAPAAVASGSPLTVEAVPHGFMDPVFQFWWAGPDGRWQSSGPFAPAASFTVPDTEPGVWQVLVYAREATAPDPESAAQQARYEAKSATHQVVVSGGGTAVAPPPPATATGSVVLSTRTWVPLGGRLAFAAEPRGIADPVFQFWFKTPAGIWESSGPYGPADTFSTPADAPGTWYAMVYARPASAPTNETAAERAAYEVASAVVPIGVTP